MLTSEFLRAKFDSGATYRDYVNTGTPAQQADWSARHDAVRLLPGQRAILEGFTRRLNILVLSGLWCGDCAQQCPMLDHLARVNPTWISLRLLDRDLNLDLAEPLRVCGGLRVPTVIFLNEDFEFVHMLADRTLSRYRAIAARSTGIACVLPAAAQPAAELDETLQDWVNEVERAYWVVRLSPKLRERHQD